MAAANSGAPVLVCATDDAYALALAAMLRSAVDNLAPRRALEVFLLDGGIAARNRSRIQRSLDLDRIQLHWLAPLEDELGTVKLSGHISAAAYLRLLAPDLLPGRVRKAIYLDSDLVVKGDLGRLWDQDLAGPPLLAVQDVNVPTVGCPRGLRNYRELGLDANLKYFNSGVLVLDLERWREERLAAAVLGYLQEHWEQVRWWDQDCLNAVLAGRWGELDPRWNQLAHIHEAASWRETPFTREVYEAVLAEPYVVHFATSSKPWHFDCRHPERDLFFQYLDRTAWAGWRPRRIPGARQLQRLRRLLSGRRSQR